MARKRILKQLYSKSTLTIFACLYAFIVIMGSTFAWVTSSDTRINNFKQEGYGQIFSVTVVDAFNPIPEGGLYHKRVGAQNNGTLPGFVRLLVIPVLIVPGEDGQPDTFLPAQWGTHVSISDLNTNDWIDGGDGYFYYKHKLAPGVSTDDLGTNLFNTVSLPVEVPEGYENATLKIEVKCEAVNINQWNYRDGWWGGRWPDNIPPSGPLKEVDDALKELAQ